MTTRRKAKNPKFLDDFMARFRKPAKPKRNNTLRDRILGVDTSEDGVTRLPQITLYQLDALIAEGFTEPNDRQNRSPTASQFLNFMKRWPTAVANGYAVHPDRDDYRVTVEGLDIDVRHMNKFEKQRLAEALEILWLDSPPDEFEKSKNVWRVWWD